MDAPDLLLAASAVHAGFQVTVSVVVYPALRDAARADWERVHAAHSRRISFVVAPLYVVVAGACLAALLSGPGAAALVAVVGNAVACLTTALVAAPLHGRLGRATATYDAAARRTVLLTQLLRVDLVRTAATLVAVAAALVDLS